MKTFRHDWLTHPRELDPMPLAETDLLIYLSTIGRIEFRKDKPTHSQIQAQETQKDHLTNRDEEEVLGRRNAKPTRGVTKVLIPHQIFAPMVNLYQLSRQR